MKNFSRLRTIARKRPREVGAASICMLSVVGIAALAPGRGQPVGPTAIVRVGALAETLVEAGTIGSSRLLLYGSSISGVQAKIAEIVPEGSTVAPGDVLVRFDTTPFQQNLAREEAALRQAEAELLRLREELRIERLRAEGEVAQATAQIGYAQSDLANQLEGKGRVAIAEVEAAEGEAVREVERARVTFEDMRPMLAKGFITRLELDRAEQALKRAEEQLRLSGLRREAMVGFERPAASARSRTDLDAAQQALTRQKETAKARLNGHEAAVRAASSRIDEISARASLLHDQIARCVIRSDAAGMVVYRELFFGNDKRKPQIGDEVWSNQPLIALPDFSQLTVDTRIREIDLRHVTVGRRVKVTLPAYPGLELSGKISLIGALAEQDPTRAGTKFFPVVVSLDGHDARLRTGMTAQVEIHIATIANTMLVPVQAVFDVDDHSTVFVMRGRRPVAREVRVAAQNDRDAAVAGGVSAGEVVLLVDPRNANRNR